MFLYGLWIFTIRFSKYHLIPIVIKKGIDKSPSGDLESKQP